MAGLITGQLFNKRILCCSKSPDEKLGNYGEIQKCTYIHRTTFNY